MQSIDFIYFGQVSHFSDFYHLLNTYFSNLANRQLKDLKYKQSLGVFL
jgi:hypothetical protein